MPQDIRMIMHPIEQAMGPTYAPLYCATSSPSTKTFSFCSISSAIASFRASRTVISLAPLDDAYPRLFAIDGIAAVARNAGRKVGAGREADTRRAAGRKSLEAAIAVAIRGMEEEERYVGRGRAMAGGDGVVKL